MMDSELGFLVTFYTGIGSFDDQRFNLGGDSCSQILLTWCRTLVDMMDCLDNLNHLDEFDKSILLIVKAESTFVHQWNNSIASHEVDSNHHRLSQLIHYDEVLFGHS